MPVVEFKRRRKRFLFREYILLDVTDRKFPFADFVEVVRAVVQDDKTPSGFLSIISK